MADDISYVALSRLLLASVLWNSLVWAADSRSRELYVYEGDRVDMPCPLRPSNNGERPTLVLWFKDKGTESIYSFDVRNAISLSEGKRWSDDAVWGGRAFFSIKSTPSSLVVKPSTAADHGRYKCRVEYKGGYSTIVIVDLNVIVPPEPPVLFWKGREVVGLVGPVMMGDAVELLCQTQGGRPSPMLTWWKGGSRLESVTVANVVRGKALVRATITLHATRDLHGVPVSCHAQPPKPPNGKAQPPKTIDAILNVTLPPLTVQISGLDDSLSEGTTARPMCTSAGSNPLADIRWFKNDQRIEHSSKSVMAGGNITRSTVTFQVNRFDHATNIRCQATNPHLPSYLQHMHLITDSVNLKVSYKPYLTIRLGRMLDPTNLIEGKDAFVECIVDANPAPNRYQWFHNDQSVESKNGMIMSGANLALQGLRKSHSGTYKCGAQNEVGETVSSILEINVKYSPICAFKKNRTQGAALGSSINIACVVESDPKQNVTFSWSKIIPSGREMHLSNDNVTSNGLKSYLIFTPRHRGDFGFFLCRARNAIGEQKTPCRIRVVSAGPPEPPVNCSGAPGSSVLTVSCDMGFHGGFLQQFHLLAWTKGKLVTNTTSEIPFWIIENLIDGAELKVQIHAENAKGASKPVSFDTHMPIAHQQSVTIPDAASNSMGPILGAILGGLAVICILFFVAFITICRRKKIFLRSKTNASTEDISNNECKSPDVVSSVQKRSSSPPLDVLEHAVIDEMNYDAIVRDTCEDPGGGIVSRYRDRGSISPLSSDSDANKPFQTLYVASPHSSSLPRSNSLYVKLYNPNSQQASYVEVREKSTDAYKRSLPLESAADLARNKIKDRGSREACVATDKGDESDNEKEDENTYAILNSSCHNSHRKMLIKTSDVTSLPKNGDSLPSPMLRGTANKHRKQKLLRNELHCGAEPFIKAVTKTPGDCRESTV